MSLRQNLRDLDRRECGDAPLAVRKTLRMTLGNSLVARAVVAEDGRTVAAWGMGGALVSDEGNPWLLTACGVERFRLSLVREGQAFVAEMLEWRPYLWNYVLAEYAAAIRLLEVLGFYVDPPVVMAGAMWRKFQIWR